MTVARVKGKPVGNNQLRPEVGFRIAKWIGKIRCLQRLGIPLIVAFGFLLVPAAYAATFSISPTTSTDGKFTLKYTGNTRYYVFFVETTSGSDVDVQTHAGASASGSVAVSKPNGTYRYRLRLCDSLTGGFAGNCSYTAVKSVVVNRTSGSGSVSMSYKYDALGRLVQTRENGTIVSGYCYDEAGNRKAVTAGTSNDPCAAYEPPPPATLPAPTGLSAYTHSGGGYVISWNAVPGAAEYRLRLVNDAPNPDRVINGQETTYYTNTSQEAPKWIQACDSAGVCSSRAYF